MEENASARSRDCRSGLARGMPLPAQRLYLCQGVLEQVSGRRVFLLRAAAEHDQPSGYRCVTSLWSRVNFLLGEGWYAERSLVSSPQSSLATTFVCMSGLLSFMYCTEGRNLCFNVLAYYRLLGV